MVYSPAPIMSALTGIFIDLSGDPFPRVCPGAFKYLRAALALFASQSAADGHDERVPIRTTLTEDGLRGGYLSSRTAGNRNGPYDQTVDQTRRIPRLAGNAMWRSTRHISWLTSRDKMRRAHGIG